MAVANENQPAIGRAIVLPGATRYGARTYSATYTGLMQDERGTVRRGLFKDLPVGDLVRELVGTSAAIRAEIGVPPAFLAIVEDGLLETAKGPALNDRWRLMFATEFVDGAQLVQLLGQPLPDSILVGIAMAHLFCA